MVQRKMVRFVRGWDARHHVSPRDICGLSWIPIPDRVEFLKMMHLVFKNDAPISDSSQPSSTLPAF